MTGMCPVDARRLPLSTMRLLIAARAADWAGVATAADIAWLCRRLL